MKVEKKDVVESDDEDPYASSEEVDTFTEMEMRQRECFFSNIYTLGR
jgi:hypothetical protein